MLKYLIRKEESENLLQLLSVGQPMSLRNAGHIFLASCKGEIITLAVNSCGKVNWEEFIIKSGTAISIPWRMSHEQSQGMKEKIV